MLYFITSGHPLGADVSPEAFELFPQPVTTTPNAIKPINSITAILLNFI
jgi:hypothetical protein